MLCDICKKNPATVHFLKIVNGQKTEMNLCQECAARNQEVNFNVNFNNFWTNFHPASMLSNFLAGLFGQEIQQPYITPGGKTCSLCGQDFAAFTRTGLMGCPRCYKVMEEETEPILRRIHGNVRHTGKVPRRGGGTLRLRREIEGLKRQLQQAVAREEFEKAAELRDRIRELEKKLAGEGEGGMAKWR
ncbi:MAG: protein arginine kinase activator [Eubacteriales bacterium]|nr:protein arginine kinase activator [Eubacteriales bacterium]MDN5364308.1 protein arginine kinase activator [Eubacteriales bacterium]